MWLIAFSDDELAEPCRVRDSTAPASAPWSHASSREEDSGPPRPLPERHRAPSFPALYAPTREDLDYAREVAAKFKLECLDAAETEFRPGDNDEP
jgi:hypothetical protein